MRLSPQASTNSPAGDPSIATRILIIRGLRVIIDADLAAMYAVPTKRLNEQVKRNPARFPSDFMFQLTVDEKAEVVANCDHLHKLKFTKALPYAFTEHGTVQASNVLGSSQAIEVGLHVVRAFAQLRQLSTAHNDIALRLSDLEQNNRLLTQSHNQLSEATQSDIAQLFEAVRQLMQTPEPAKRAIGFI